MSSLELPLRPIRERGDGSRLIVAHFHDQPPAIVSADRAARLVQQLPIDVEPILSAEQGDVRLVVADLDRQSLEVAKRDIWRIGHDEVDIVLRREIAGVQEGNSPVDTVTGGVPPRDVERRTRDVGGDQQGLRKFLRQGYRKASTAGAHVHDDEACVAGERDESRLDDELAFGTRREDVARDLEVEAPELAVS